MNEFNVENFEDFGNFLFSLSEDRIRSSWVILVALFEKQRKMLDESIPDEDVMSLLGDPSESVKERLSLFEQQMPIFRKESEEMVRCAKLLFNEKMTEGRIDGEKMIEAIEKLHETHLKILETSHHSLRFSADPKAVIAEYIELDEQNSKPFSSNSGCMVVLGVLIVSIVVTIL